MTNDPDPWTYQLAVGLGPQPGPDPTIPPAVRCPACGGRMRANLFNAYGSDHRYWHCLTCNLTILRPDGDPS